ncbi:MAG: carboxypeptidase-like regulatory domain-containing protein [Planctomycetota bacterium]
MKTDETLDDRSSEHAVHARRAAGRPEASQRSSVAPATAASGTTGLVGRVIGTNGDPVPSIEVVAWRVDRREGVTETDENGRFVITGLLPGDGYRVSIGNDHRAIGSREDVEVVENVLSDLGDLAARPGASVRGVVRAQTGEPIAGARVEIESSWRSEPVVSDEWGRFDAGVLFPGRTALAIEAEGWALPEAYVRELLEGEVVTDLELTLVPAAPITGVVVDELGGRLAGASIEAIRTGSAVFAQRRDVRRSDGRGRFAFESLAPGTYRISVTRPGHRPKNLSRVDAGAGPLELVLERSAVIEGTVVDRQTGRPVVADSLRIWWARPRRDGAERPALQLYQEPIDVSIRQDGSFTIGVERAGTMRVEAQARGFAPTLSSRFEVGRKGVTPAVMVRLRRGARLSVSVLDRQTRGPVAQAIVDVHRASPLLGQPPAGDAASSVPARELGARVARGRTGADGAVAIDSLPQGSFVLCTRRDGYAPERVGIVRVDETPPRGPIEVLLGRGGSIEGRVARPGGEPEPAVELLATSSAGYESKALSLADGLYRLDHLSPGRYRVEVIDSRVLPSHDASETLADEGEFPVIVVDGEATPYDLTVRRIEPGSLTGSLTINGETAAGMTVIPHRFEGGRYMPRFGGEVRAKTDDRGRFEFRSLAPGLYSLRAFRTWAESYDCGQVTIRPNEEALAIVDIRLGAIRGLVLDADSQPLAGASIHVQRESTETSAWDPLGGGQSGASGPDGRFSFELEAGSYAISVQAEGHAPRRIEGVQPLVDGGNDPLQVRLKKSD